MKLAERDKYLIGLAVAVILIGLLAQFVVLPFLSERERLQRGIASKQQGLQDITQLSREYRAFQSDSEGIAQRLARRPKNFTLFSFLEQAASETRVKDKIKYMKPSSAMTGQGPFQESLVEMKLERISLQDLVNYLRRIESPEKTVSIKRIAINANKKEAEFLDAVMQVLTFQ